MTESTKPKHGLKRVDLAGQAANRQAEQASASAAKSTSEAAAFEGRAIHTTPPTEGAQLGDNLAIAAPNAACALVARLGGQRCADFRLAISARPIRSRSGWAYFYAMLVGPRNEYSTTALAEGVASAGGRGVRPWLEVRIHPQVVFADQMKVETRERGLEKGVIEALAALVPPGGHLMVDYESGGQEETFAELVLGVPPLATRLGEMLFAAGFRGQFKDWYFSEGGHEGPRKLQANKPVDEQMAERVLRQHHHDLRAFLAARMSVDGEQAKIIERAKQRAAFILAEFFT
jgi:hypothetical protein